MNEMRPKLLIVEQDLALLTQLRWHLDQYEVLTATSRERAIAEVRRHEPALVILDPNLSENEGGFEEGLRCLREMNDLIPSAKTIVITQRTSPQLAMRLLELGVHDLFEKPVVAEVLEVVLQRAAFLSDLEQRRREAARQSASQLPGFISQDPILIQLTARASEIAKQRQRCLIEGPMGSGRKRFARAMHPLAFKKPSAQCLLFDLATQVPELNRHLQDAQQSQPPQRHTFICYNVEQLDTAAQSRLNTLLEKQQQATVAERHLWLFLREDADQYRKLNSGLRETLEQNSLRLPSLQARPNDVALLARFFLSQHRRINPNVKGIHAAAIEAIEAQEWQSVRELENTIETGLRACKTRLMNAEDIGLAQAREGELNLRGVRQQAETQAILRSLTAANGNVSKAALLLGVTRPTLYDLIKKYQIKVPTAAEIRRQGQTG